MKINHTKNKIHLTFYVNEIDEEKQEVFFEELKNSIKNLYCELLKAKKEREKHDSASAD